MVFTVANRETGYTAIDVDNLTLLAQGVWNHLRKRSADELLRQKSTDLEAAFEEITATDEELRANYEDLAGLQNALAESERKHRELYHFAQVGLFETSFKDATVIACNQRYADLAGFASVEEATGKDVLGLYVNPEDRTEVGRILRELGAVENYTLKLRNRKTGKVFWGQFSARYNYEREVAEGSIIDISEQKEAEQNLRMSEERYRLILSTMQDAYFRADRAGIITMANPAAAVMYGYPSPESMIGMPAVSLYRSPEDRDEMLRQLDAAGRITDYYGQGRRKDGSLFWVSLNIQLTFDAAGKVVASEGFVRDITERRQAGEALRENEKRLREAQEMAHLGFWSWDIKTGTVEWSDEVFRIFGLVPGEFRPTIDSVLSRSPWPEEQQRDKELIKRAMASHEPGSYEQRFLRPDASTGYYHSTFEGRYDEAGNLVSIVGTALDITERKKAEDEQARLAAIVEFSDEAIIGKTLDGTITSWNAGAERMYGYPAAEVTGRNISLLLPPDQEDDTPQILEQIRNGHPVLRYETVRRTKDGGQIHVLLTVSPIRDAENRVTGASTIAHDITDRKQLEEQLKTSESRYRRFFEAIRDGILILDAETGTILNVNPFLVELLGFTHEQFLGKKLWEIGIFKDIAASKDNFKELQEKKYIHFEDLPLETADGRQIDAEFVSYVYDVEGRKVMQCNIRDITERKKAEAGFAAAQQQYRDLVENVHIGILKSTPGPRGTLTEANPAALRIFGAGSREELFALSASDLYYDMDERQKVSEEILARGAVDAMEVKYKTLKGRAFWGRITAIKKIADDGHVYFYNTIEDITDRKRAERALQESEEKYRNLYANSQVGMFRSRIDGTGILDLNKKLTEIFGYTREEMLKDPATIRWAHPEKRDEMLKQLKDKGSITDYEMEIIPKNNQIRVLVISLVINQKEGYIEGSVSDITDRKRLEEQIKTSEIRYRRFFEAIRDGILIIDAETGTILDVNPFMIELLGFSHEQFLGKKLWEIGIFRDIAANKDNFKELQEKKYIRFENLPLETAEGRQIDSEFVSIVYDVEGKNVMQCNIRDITDRKRAEVLREHLIRELEQKNAELERFTYTVSHDLKSPLITIKGFASLLEDDVMSGDPLQLKKDVSRIMEAAETMQSLLSDVLELARVGKIISPPHSTPFGKIVHEAVDLLAGPLAERGVTVDIRSDLPDVYVDHVRIREVMTNLIENAVKSFGDRPDPVIRIGVDRRGDTPVFFVQDNGIGIDPRYLERIFNLFEKLNVSAHGTGIGLTIVRRIIEVHGGKIWAESEGPGKGTVFRFTLPGMPGPEEDSR